MRDRPQLLLAVLHYAPAHGSMRNYGCLRFEHATNEKPSASLSLNCASFLHNSKTEGAAKQWQACDDGEGSREEADEQCVSDR